MSQRITTNSQITIDGDLKLKQLSHQITSQLLIALEEASALGGEDQVVESIKFGSFEELSSYEGRTIKRVGELQVVTRLT